MVLCFAGDLEKVKFIVNAGANVNYIDFGGRNALIIEIGNLGHAVGLTIHFLQAGAILFCIQQSSSMILLYTKDC